MVIVVTSSIRRPDNSMPSVDVSRRWFDPPNMASPFVSVLIDVAIAVVTGLVIFGGTVPYYFQYREMVRSQNAGGFSLYVCLTLLMANILRILFWFGNAYETPLLLQSLVMVLCMLAMVELSVRIQAKQFLPPRQQSGTIWDGHVISNFWRWTDFGSYLAVTIGFAVLMSIITAVMVPWSTVYVETLGFLALFLEANLAAPQLWANYVRKSTAGMSVSMVLMWLFGDVTKTIYFLVRSTPAQFWTCGIYQIIVDIIILIQTRCYRRGTIAGGAGGGGIIGGPVGLKVTKSQPSM